MSVKCPAFADAQPQLHTHEEGVLLFNNCPSSLSIRPSEATRIGDGSNIKHTSETGDVLYGD